MMIIDNNTVNSYNIFNEVCNECNALCRIENCACSDNHLLGYSSTENEVRQTSCNLNSFTKCNSLFSKYAEQGKKLFPRKYT